MERTYPTPPLRLYVRFKTSCSRQQWEEHADNVVLQPHSCRACAFVCRGLRRVDYSGSGACELKLTQKVPAGRPGYVQGLITSTYLSAAEYDLLASLPAEVLSKRRLSVPPLSIDLFDPPLHGLVLADAEFSTDEAAQSFLQPPAAIAEVTDDARFTGGSLVRTRRHDLLAWLAEYGIELQQTE